MIGSLTTQNTRPCDGLLIVRLLKVVRKMEVDRYFRYVNALCDSLRPLRLVETKKSSRLEELFVRMRGVEPPRPRTLPPEDSASTNSATCANGMQRKAICLK